MKNGKTKKKILIISIFIFILFGNNFLQDPVATFPISPKSKLILLIEDMLINTEQPGFIADGPKVHLDFILGRYLVMYRVGHDPVNLCWDSMFVSFREQNSCQIWYFAPFTLLALWTSIVFTTRALFYL